jgi:hypothetical protein
MPFSITAQAWLNAAVIGCPCVRFHGVENLDVVRRRHRVSLAREKQISFPFPQSLAGKPHLYQLVQAKACMQLTNQRVMHPRGQAVVSSLNQLRP